MSYQLRVNSSYPRRTHTFVLQPDADRVKFLSSEAYNARSSIQLIHFHKGNETSLGTWQHYESVDKIMNDVANMIHDHRHGPSLNRISLEDGHGKVR